MLERSECRDVWLFDVYGVTFALRSGDPQLAIHLAENFEHFRVERLADAPGLSLESHRAPPSYESVPDRPATVYTPLNVSFQESGRTYIVINACRTPCCGRRTRRLVERP
jgi:hypothetical protein